MLWYLTFKVSRGSAAGPTELYSICVDIRRNSPRRLETMRRGAHCENRLEHPLQLVKNQAPDSAEDSRLTSNGGQMSIPLEQERAKPASRSLLIDAVRGMAISLVALGHTNQGILHRGWWGASQAGFRLDVIIYAFHMPAFFFMSGIFLCSSVRKRGPRRFTLERIRTLIYPYVLWSLISAATVVVLSHYMVQRPLSRKQFLIDLVVGAGIWFLPALFACQMFGLLLRKLPGPVTVGIAVLAYYFLPRTGVNFFDLALLFFPFVAAGMWMGRGYEHMRKFREGLLCWPPLRYLGRCGLSCTSHGRATRTLSCWVGRSAR